MRLAPLTLASGIALACSFSPATSEAQSSTTSTAIFYDVVTEYTAAYNLASLSFVGVVAGANAPSELTISFGSYTNLESACERALIQMINRPGRFQLGVDAGQAVVASGATIFISRCTLRQKT